MKVIRKPRRCDALQETLRLTIPKSTAIGLPRERTADDLMPEFTFADIFAGIGGFRIGLQRVGGRCVFSCEWDEHAQRTYFEWFGELPFGDIRKLDLSTIEPHVLLAAGFPCQPFSIAGVSKKKSLGREHGFRDETQGTLFFHLAEIIDAKRPKILLLENVKNLLSHDQGNTWQIILRTLAELKYHVFAEVIDAAGWVPQHRERVFIVCFDMKYWPQRPQFSFPIPPPKRPVLADVLEVKPDRKYTLTDKLWTYLQNYAENHRQKGNGFGFGLVDLTGITRTLSARYYKDGSEILIPQGRGKNPRRLTPSEAARLMGFTEKRGEKFPIVVSDTQAYKQFGNAVVPAVVEALARQIIKTWRARHQVSGTDCRPLSSSSGVEAR